MLATGGTDGFVKIWDVSTDTAELVVSRNLGVGEVLSIAFSKYDIFALAVGGTFEDVAIWDVDSEKSVQRKFAGRV